MLRVLESHDIGIDHAVLDFLWSNKAMKQANVICRIAVFRASTACKSRIISDGQLEKQAKSIGPYLLDMEVAVVAKRKSPLSQVRPGCCGSWARDGGNLFFDLSEYLDAKDQFGSCISALRPAIGGQGFIKGTPSYCIYLSDEESLSKEESQYFANSIEATKSFRKSSKRAATAKLSSSPQHFAERNDQKMRKVFVPQTQSANREYLIAGLIESNAVIIAPHFQIIGGTCIELCLLTSRMHRSWIDLCCGKLKTDLRYSTTLGWNTFPTPNLSMVNRDSLETAGRNILIARESYWPATIADMYDPDRMDTEFPRLREAHEHNDEVLERIYIGRRFKNDTERLEKLFEIYAAATKEEASA